MKKIVAIGGGENGRILEDGSKAPYNTRKIDEEIVKLTGKNNPNFLFINHVMNSLEIQDSYYETMKKIYGDIFNCNCNDLKTNELYDINIVKERIKWADIIYEGGGDTSYMLDLWKKTNFDNILYSAWNDGKVICGISAGAVCWFNSCNSDYNDTFVDMDCLNWIDCYVCPHADESGRIDSTINHLKKNNKKGILLSNCCAIEILDDNYKIIKSAKNSFAQLIYIENNKTIIKDISKGKIKDLI